MPVTTYTKAGTKSTTPAKLSKAVFGVIPTNHALLQEAYVAYLANGRLNLAVTKTRGLVSGGGKKPWRQKGTGRARFGSSRVPIWRGGGITFGPTGEENYSKQLNVKAKRQAIRQALSLSAEAGKVIIIEDVESKTGKTAELAKFLEKIGANSSVLLIVDQKATELIRAASNLSGLKVISALYVNVFDALNADKIVITEKALAAIEEWLGTSTGSTSKEDK
ncbi:MAG TPA: 50S ribosomal protein L4 [Candidatus Saccharimonadales bacterium]|nr:50S ribosomal protein L4 [Candidatus Saccharimonadales bacterium]